MVIYLLQIKNYKKNRNTLIKFRTIVTTITKEEEANSGNIEKIDTSLTDLKDFQNLSLEQQDKIIEAQMTNNRTTTADLQELLNKMKQDLEDINHPIDYIKEKKKTEIDEIPTTNNINDSQKIINNNTNTTSQTITNDRTISYEENKILSMNTNELKENENTAFNSSDSLQHGYNPIMANSIIDNIRISCAATGEKISETLKKKDILLQETEKAEKRQESLYKNIGDFISQFPGSRTAKYLAFGTGLSLTAYYILRYREIPFSGFFFKNSNLSEASKAIGNLNINLSMPTAAPSPTQFGIPTIPSAPIHSNIPTPQWMSDISPTVALIGGIVITFLLRFRK